MQIDRFRVGNRLPGDAENVVETSRVDVVTFRLLRVRIIIIKKKKINVLISERIKLKKKNN